MLMLGGSVLHGLAGTADVQQLQQALVALAAATNRPAINPGPVTGNVSDQTMMGLAAGLDLLTEQLPATVYLTLQAAMLIGTTSSTAKEAVAASAPELAAAAAAAALKYKLSGTSTSAPTTLPGVGVFAQIFAPGWYATPFGLGLIALVGYGAYKMFFATPRTA